MSLFDQEDDPGVSSLQGMSPMAPPPGLMTAPPPPQGSMLDRIIHRLKSNIQGDAPAGLDTVLGAKGVENARPTLFQTIFGEGGPDAFHKNLSEAVQAAQLPDMMQSAELERRKQQNFASVREQIKQEFPPSPNETPEEVQQRGVKMYLRHFQLGGDPKETEYLAHFMGEAVKAPKNPVLREPIQTKGIVGDPSGKYPGQPVVRFTDPDTRRPVIGPDGKPMEYLESAPPTDPVVLAMKQQAAASLELQRRQMQGTREDQNDMAQVRLFNAQPAAKAMLLSNARYSGFLNSVESAKRDNPYAVAPALFGMVTMLEPNAQLRQGILRDLKLPAGIIARGEAAFTNALSGKLNPTMLAHIQELVSGRHQADKALYTQYYNDIVSKNPRLASHPDLMAPDVAFDIPGVVNPTSAPGLKYGGLGTPGKPR
jgi:hypothetical protein